MRKRWFVLYCAGWVILAVVGAEAVLRASDAPLTRLRRLVQPADPERHYSLTPGVDLLFEGLKDPLDEPVRWSINSMGIRDSRELSRLPGRGKLRVSTYGDSETFGWSVSFEQTFQQRMEALDDRLEVLNFGVPGYNIGNIARHIEETVPVLRPDLIVYIVHPNDFEEPLRYHRLIVESELLRRSLLLVYNLRETSRHGDRRAPASIASFRRDLARINAYSKREAIPLVVGFLRSEDVRIGTGDLGGSEALARGAPQGPEVLDLEPSVYGYELVDAHLPAAAHARLAAFLYEELVIERVAIGVATMGSGSGR